MNVPASTPSLKVNQIFIQGRIQHVSKYENKFDHVIVTPAPDAYSKPELMRVSSSNRLGSKDEDVKVLCTYHGWSNTYKNKDGEPVNDVKGFFVAVE